MGKIIYILHIYYIVVIVLFSGAGPQSAGGMYGGASRGAMTQGATTDETDYAGGQNRSGASDQYGSAGGSRPAQHMGGGMPLGVSGYGGPSAIRGGGMSVYPYGTATMGGYGGGYGVSGSSVLYQQAGGMGGNSAGAASASSGKPVDGGANAFADGSAGYNSGYRAGAQNSNQQGRMDNRGYRPY